MLQKIENWDDITRVLVPRVNAAIDLLNKLSQIHGDGLTITIDEAMDYEIRLLADQIVPGAGGGETYSGYFKVVNASSGSGSERVLKIKVIDGAAPDSGFCGHATFNDTHFEVPVFELAVTVSGFLFLKSTMGVATPPLPMAPAFEFVTAWPATEYGVGRRLIATVKVADNALAIAQQQHGEIQAFIWGECEK